MTNFDDDRMNGMGIFSCFKCIHAKPQITLKTKIFTNYLLALISERPVKIAWIIHINPPRNFNYLSDSAD
ncbi:hypothetical protein [Delftia sp. PS-11]|uniref:hypothetical protein n=1 Tax=Delftia sp. PS-11 TaxID=2767222 RepID=UPI002455CBB7|nr:hypothetical protein [Delftia sp. PS-11]KAJ8746504.1 hypothetical protein H9T68_02580 [Delftia sp. PS-11]